MLLLQHLEIAIFIKLLTHLLSFYGKQASDDKLNFENLHSFLWLTKLDRKNSKDITKEYN